MSNDCLIAEFNDHPSLEIAMEVFSQGNYDTDMISIVTSAAEVDDTVLTNAKNPNPMSPPVEKTTGVSAFAGATLGTLLGTATMVGPMLIAGPLAGLAVGAVGGGLLSAVESWGVESDVGQRYQDRVAGGSSLMIVKGDAVKLAEAERMLQTCDPASLRRFKN